MARQRYPFNSADYQLFDDYDGSPEKVTALVDYFTEKWRWPDKVPRCNSYLVSRDKSLRFCTTLLIAARINGMEHKPCGFSISLLPLLIQAMILELRGGNLIGHSITVVVGAHAKIIFINVRADELNCLLRSQPHSCCVFLDTAVL